MKISDLFGVRRALVSFEFFPPKSLPGETALYQTIERLGPLNPAFVSVTYGAGGSSRDKTIGLVTRIKNEIGIEAMAHLTCVGHSRAELAAILDRLEANGIENVLPLRGDPPQGETAFRPAPDGFSHGNELVAFIRERGYPFCLAGAGYPEGHVECRDRVRSMQHLKQKVDAGLDFVVTQLFYDNADYRDFVTRARAAGITVPLIPGIMPITNAAQIRRIASLCGARIPASLQRALEAASGDEEETLRIGVREAIAQCRELLRDGAPGIHFYTLNKSPATRAIFEQLRADGLVD
jgi:methylenetetrahydrofolate reductase (NADPH)